MAGHYIELLVEDGEVSVQFTCTHKRGAECHKQNPNPDAEVWYPGDPDLIDTDECWTESWWEGAGTDALRVTTDGVIARVPVDISYDEGIEATPITEPEPEALFAVDPAPTEAELTAGDLAVAIEVARERAELLATVRPDPDDARQVETVADIEISFKIRHPNGGGTIKTRIGPTNARAVLTALAAMGGERS